MEPNTPQPPKYTQPEPTSGQPPEHKPVAYDPEGRPLYYHPPAGSDQNHSTGGQQPQIVYMTRPMEPLSPHISERAQRRHEESKKKYPFLNISEGEFVISNVKRHPIGLLSVWSAEIIAILLFSAVYLYSLTPAGVEMLHSMGLTLGGLTWMAFLVILLLGLLGWAGTIIYLANQFYLTNESVIQFIQTGLFSRKEQTISLQNIEDASFRQHGIIQHIFDYGSIRLSTEGDETTYRFYYAQHPRRQIALLNNAVESFKNGRPVLDDSDD